MYRADRVIAEKWDAAFTLFDGDPTQAAIASEEAARRYHLHVIKRDIANQTANFTRFWVVATEARSYDRQGRLTQQTLTDAVSTVIDARTYSHDPNGTRASAAPLLPGPGCLHHH